MKYLKDTEKKFSKKKSIYDRFINMPKKNIYHYKGYIIRYLENNYIKKGYTLLDIGAGNGEMLYNSRAEKIIVFDRDNYFEEEFYEDGIKFYKLDVSNDLFPLKDNSVDVITINHVIEHLADYKTLMSECKRVLKPKGLLIITTPDINASKLRLDFWNGRPTRFNFWNDPTHIKPYTLKGIKRLYNMFDFKILKAGHTPPLEYIYLCLLVSYKKEKYLNKYYEKLGTSNILIIGENEK